MRNINLLIFLVSVSSSSFSQNEVLIKYEKERNNYSKRSMLVLGGWSTANIIVSGFATNTRNREKRYFHQMNVMWGGINLVIAGLGYWGARKEKINNPTLSSVLKHQNKTEKTYLLNAGLDIGYITGGLYLTERSKRQNDPAKFKGYGNSIMMQGGFLLFYDAIIYLLHTRHGKQLDGLLEKLDLRGVPGSISVVYTF